MEQTNKQQKKLWATNRNKGFVIISLLSVWKTFTCQEFHCHEDNRIDSPLLGSDLHAQLMSNSCRRRSVGALTKKGVPRSMT